MAASTSTSSRIQHLGQAAAALAPHRAVDVPAPQVLALPRRLQLALHLHRPVQLEVETLERGIAGLELTDRLDRAALQVPDVHSQHSRLK